jgi:hypothetical protein
MRVSARQRTIRHHQRQWFVLESLPQNALVISNAQEVPVMVATKMVDRRLRLDGLECIRDFRLKPGISFRILVRNPITEVKDEIRLGVCHEAVNSAMRGRAADPFLV